MEMKERPARAEESLAWFRAMSDHCYDFAEQAVSAGRPIAGIMCEFAPREIILAAGAYPACLCGGSAARIPAAERELPVTLCPLIKSTYGYHLERANPFLEWASIVIAETTCDGKRKMFELMGRVRPMHVMELPRDPNTPEALEAWDLEIRRLAGVLEERFDTNIDKAALLKGVRWMNRERSLRRELAALMMRDNPPLTGRELLDVRTIIAGMPEALEQYEALLDGLLEFDPPPQKGRGRVLLTGVPVPHGAESIVDLIEARGGLIVAMENCSGLKPVIEDVDENASDLHREIARKHLGLACSVMSPNHRRLELIRKLAAEFRIDCVIDLVWRACLTYDIEAALLGPFVRDELGLPYLKIETDYSPSDSERLGVRIEALFETAGARG